MGDFVGAAVFLMQHYDEPEIINVGTGVDVTIRELAGIGQRATAFEDIGTRRSLTCSRKAIVTA